MLEVLAHIQQPTDTLHLVTTVGTTVIAVASMLFAGCGYFLQKRHNIMSVMPILNIFTEATDNRIYIALENNGIGPAIINELVWKSDTSSNSSLFNMINSTHSNGFKFAACSDGISKRALSPEKSIILFDYSEKDDSDFKREKEVMVGFFSKLRLEVSYTDIYNSKYEKVNHTFNNLKDL